VTGACMLVSRSMFDAVGGFDCAFRNSLEDVDLCLRAGKLGAAVRYCAEASLYHLESASRGRSSPGADPALRLFRTRWSGRVRPDDLDVYLEDGLIEIAYEATHPARLRVSPELAILDGEVGGLLFERSRQCAQLLLEITRLTARLAEERFERSHERRAPTWRAGPAAGADLDLALSRLDGIEAELHDLQVALGRLATGDPAFPSEQLGYRRTVRDVRDAVARAVPEDAAVAVVSRGDDALLDLGLRTGWHFPAASDGTYLGYHPASGEEALAWLHDARARGADYIVVPDTSRWWLTRYASFGAFLAGCERIGDESAPCSIYRLPAVSGPGPSPTRKDELVNGR